MAYGSEDRKKVGTITGTSSTIDISKPAGGTVAVQVTGTFTGTIEFQGTVNESTFVAIPATRKTTSYTTAYSFAVVDPAEIYIVDAAGLRTVRVACTAYTSGTLTVHVLGSEAASVAAGIGAVAGSIGGGTQYTEGDTDATITGTAAMWEDAANTLRAVSVANPLPIQLTDGTSVAAVHNLAANDALSVAVVNASGTQITGFGTGDVAHDAADSGNPVKIGAKALVFGTNPTAVTANDRTDLYANRAGVLFVLGGHPNIITHAVNYTAAQTDAAIISVSAGEKIVVTQLMATADKANTVDVAVAVGFGAATTPTGAGVLGRHPGIAAGSGFSRGSGDGIIGAGADGEDVRITSEVPTSGSIDIVLSYFTIPA